MSEKSKPTNGRQSRLHHLLLPVVIACSSLLASCGGGSSSTAESADGTKQALAVSGSSAVPGGWTGRAPKMEVINGITVPPEPPVASNNATIAGIDVNGNGVRDDVERIIATNSIAVTDFTNAVVYAKYYAVIVNQPTPQNRDDALKQIKLLKCSAFDSTKISPVLLPSGGSSILGATFNTTSRRSKLLAFNKIVGGHEASEVTCD